MFTGIVRAVGQIEQATVTADGRRLSIETPRLSDLLAHGDSLSVDGVCLTVERIEDGIVTVFLAAETEDRTTLGDRDPGDPVNLEPAMAATDRFDGHLVQGHVDTTTTITAIESIGEDWRFTFALPVALDQYIVEKGSVTIDGISLTVAERTADTFSIAIIPTTYEETTLHGRTVGDSVNLEVDIIAKYVESMLEARE